MAYNKLYILLFQNSILDNYITFLGVDFSCVVGGIVFTMLSNIAKQTGAEHPFKCSLVNELATFKPSKPVCMQFAV